MRFLSSAKQPFLILAISGLLAALPIFPSAILVRSQVMGHAGDVISWEVGFASIYRHVAELGYARPEEYRVLTIGLSMLLCLGSSFAIVKYATARLAALKK